MGCLLWVQSMWCMFCNWNCHTVSYNYHVKIEGVKTRPNSTELISPGHEGATASSSELELKYWSRWKQNHTPLIKQNVSPEIQDLCNHSPLIKIYIIKDLDYKTCNTDPSSTPAPFDNSVHFFLVCVASVIMESQLCIFLPWFLFAIIIRYSYRSKWSIMPGFSLHHDAYYWLNWWWSSITLTLYMVLPVFATRFADYAGGIRFSFIQPRLF